MQQSGVSVLRYPFFVSILNLLQLCIVTASLSRSVVAFFSRWPRARRGCLSPRSPTSTSRSETCTACASWPKRCLRRRRHDQALGWGCGGRPGGRGQATVVCERIVGHLSRANERKWTCLLTEVASEQWVGPRPHPALTTARKRTTQAKEWFMLSGFIGRPAGASWRGMAELGVLLLLRRLVLSRPGRAGLVRPRGGIAMHFCCVQESMPGLFYSSGSRPSRVRRAC